MNKNIEINFLKDFKKDKENHVARLDERINEIIRLKNLLLEDIENINKDIEKLESENNK